MISLVETTSGKNTIEAPEIWAVAVAVETVTVPDQRGVAVGVVGVADVDIAMQTAHRQLELVLLHLLWTTEPMPRLCRLPQTFQNTWNPKLPLLWRMLPRVRLLRLRLRQRWAEAAGPRSSR